MASKRRRRHSGKNDIISRIVNHDDFVPTILGLVSRGGGKGSSADPLKAIMSRFMK